MELILASTSPARAGILRQLRLNFRAIAPEVDETPLANEDAAALVKRLAMAKAQAVSASEEAIVIGCDQVATHQGQIIGKPHTWERAEAQLSAFSGQSVLFLTGLAVRRGSQILSHVERFAVHFRDLNAAEIRRYLQLEDVRQCAGAIKAEALGIHLFRGLEGRDPHALTGLPIIALGELLRQWNIHLLEDFDVVA